MFSFLKKLLIFDGHSHPIDVLAEINSIISGIALYPQLVKIFVEGVASGVSMISFLLIFFNSLIWILYGYHRKLIPLLISSILNTIAASGILLLILLK